MTCIKHIMHVCAYILMRIETCTSSSSMLLADRTPLCARSWSVLNGSTLLEEGLSGTRLKIGTGLWSDLYLQQTEAGELIGLERDILDELSSRASFSYDLILHNWSAVTSWTNALAETLPLYDMVTFAYWGITPERVAQGFFSPYGYFDSSLVFITLASETTETRWERLLQFAQPFTERCWLVVVLTALATGLLYWCLEAGRNEDDFAPGHGCIRQGLSAQAGAVLQLTGGGGFSPKTGPGKILLISWSVCIVLVLSAYTANMASFLVSKAEMAPVVSSIDEAMFRKSTICWTKGSPVQTWFDREYPGYEGARAESVNAVELFDDLFAEKCDGIVASYNEFSEATHNPESEQRCALQIVGEHLLRLDSGFMVLNDYREQCTTLVRDVLAVHFISMAQDGTLARLISEAYDRLASPCPDTFIEPSTPSGQLDLESMGGIMLLHVAGSSVALLVYCGQRCVIEVETEVSTLQHEHHHVPQHVPSQVYGQLRRSSTSEDLTPGPAPFEPLQL